MTTLPLAPLQSGCSIWLLRKFTLAAQQRHKRYYDAKHVPAVFAVNDQDASPSCTNLEEVCAHHQSQ